MVQGYEGGSTPGMNRKRVLGGGAALFWRPPMDEDIFILLKERYARWLEREEKRWKGQGHPDLVSVRATWSVTTRRGGPSWRHRHLVVIALPRYLIPSPTHLITQLPSQQLDLSRSLDLPPIHPPQATLPPRRPPPSHPRIVPTVHRDRT